MSVYALNFLFRETLRDHAFRAQMKSDPAAAIAGFDLTDEERKALLSADIGRLYDMGVNAFLMGYLCRFELLGLTPDLYYDRIHTSKRAAASK
jgi:hypothetical protein